MSVRRLETGGLIDRERPLQFRWDDMQLRGYTGDTLASALLASGQRVFGRSFKYHRPRGVMSAGVEESGAIVTVGSGARTDPNVKATTQELFDGLVAKGQNAFPSVRFDLGAINNLLGRFFAAGFYYKTFMGLPPFETGSGTGYWMWCERIIRKAAGMGEVCREPDPDHYDQAHGFCDLLVVGGGVAGLSAAAEAAKAGLEVWLVEQDFMLGGDLLSRTDAVAQSLRSSLIAEVEAQGVKVMTRTTAFGLYDYGVAGLFERVTDHLPGVHAHLPRHRFWTLRAKHTIVATGALERSIAFGNNDAPGVMGVAAARTYVNRFAVLPGENLVIATNNDSAYGSAVDLVNVGASVVVLDARKEVSDTVRHGAESAGVQLRFGMAPLRTRAGSRLDGVATARADGDSWRAAETLDCDGVLVSGGWSPVVNLLSHRGVKPVWDGALACFLPAPCDEPLQMAGSAAGIWQTEACETSGRAAGAQAAIALGKSVTTIQAPDIGGWQTAIRPLYEVSVPGQKLKSFVDPQHDVTTDDVRLAHHEGYVSVEHLKRYTTLGMATDQGKVGNVIGLALMADALGKDIPDVGTTTFRPPYTPISLGALVGRGVGAHFRPLRRTPMHQWNLDQGGTMTEAGLWHRPWYFAREGESLSDAYIRETTTARECVALCDVTSLGKIAIQGPDATELLNRVYSNPFAKLPVGKARYGIMLRDDGMVLDDGTTWRLGEHEYFMTTTTAHAVKVMAFLEELVQIRWPDMRVHLTSVSEQWGGVAVAGPKSREVLESVLENPVDVSNDNLPFMGVVETTFKNNIPGRIARISFSGEMAFEAYLPSDYATEVLDMLWKESEPRGGCLYGTEALGALRVEKGHVTGVELDGRVTIDDAGLGKMASTKKSYIGSVLRKRPELEREDRPRLVGIFPKDRTKTFKAGAILCEPGEVSGLGEGWITAVTHSPVLGHWIGLGYIRGGHEAWAERDAVAADPTRTGNLDVEIVSPHMYDPTGERMHG